MSMLQQSHEGTLLAESTTRYESEIERQTVSVRRLVEMTWNQQLGERIGLKCQCCVLWQSLHLTSVPFVPNATRPQDRECGRADWVSCSRLAGTQAVLASASLVRGLSWKEKSWMIQLGSSGEMIQLENRQSQCMFTSHGDWRMSVRRVNSRKKSYFWKHSAEEQLSRENDQCSSIVSTHVHLAFCSIHLHYPQQAAQEWHSSQFTVDLSVAFMYGWWATVKVSLEESHWWSVRRALGRASSQQQHQWKQEEQ